MKDAGPHAVERAGCWVSLARARVSRINLVVNSDQDMVNWMTTSVHCWSILGSEHDSDYKQCAFVVATSKWLRGIVATDTPSLCPRFPNMKSVSSPPWNLQLTQVHMKMVVGNYFIEDFYEMDALPWQSSWLNAYRYIETPYFGQRMDDLFQNSRMLVYRIILFAIFLTTRNDMCLSIHAANLGIYFC